MQLRQHRVGRVDVNSAPLASRCLRRLYECGRAEELAEVMDGDPNRRPVEQAAGLASGDVHCTISCMEHLGEFVSEDVVQRPPSLTELVEPGMCQERWKVKMAD